MKRINMCGKNTDLMCVIIFLFLIRPLVTPGIDTINDERKSLFVHHLLFSFNTYSRKQATVSGFSACFRLNQQVENPGFPITYEIHSLLELPPLLGISENSEK